MTDKNQYNAHSGFNFKIFFLYLKITANSNRTFIPGTIQRTLYL